MLRRHIEFYFKILQVLDALLLCASLWAAHSIRYQLITALHIPDLGKVAPFSNYSYSIILALMLPLSG